MSKAVKKSPVVSHLASVVQSRLQEIDNQIGGLTDEHLRWFKGFVYYRFETKGVRLFVDITVSPRRLFIVPTLEDGSVMPIEKWKEYAKALQASKSAKKPMLHPHYWPAALGLPEWKFTILRTEPKQHG